MDKQEARRWICTWARAYKLAKCQDLDEEGEVELRLIGVLEIFDGIPEAAAQVGELMAQKLLGVRDALDRLDRMQIPIRELQLTMHL